MILEVVSKRHPSNGVVEAECHVLALASIMLSSEDVYRALSFEALLAPHLAPCNVVVADLITSARNRQSIDTFVS